MEWQWKGYHISTDPVLLDLDTIHRFISRSYWAAGRTKETIKRSIEQSLCFGCLRRGLSGGIRACRDRLRHVLLVV